MNWITKNLNPNSILNIRERRVGIGQNEVLFLDIELTFRQEEVPQPVVLKCRFDDLGVYSTWGNSGVISERYVLKSWKKNITKSRFSSGLPLHALVSLGGRNRLTVALSDAAVSSMIGTGVVEETAEIELEIQLFTQPQNAIKEYRATVYLDFGDKRYEDAIRGAVDWWKCECGYDSAPVPDTARRPMYSTWYSLHQAVDSTAIVEQCRMAKALGMECVIVDDGWQTDDAARGYAYCGDWVVSSSKIPDMKAFVDAVHATGMKIMLWYSIPFVGKYSEAYSRFSDMFLGLRERNADGSVAILDPRYPEVREYLLMLYENAVRDWDIDGLKLDFIDSFQLFQTTVAEDSRRDIVSLEESVDRLLYDITKRLRAIKPEIMIECRQSYIGPNIRRCGNMLRVRDCPGDALVNRRSVIDLRLTSDIAAVHSDMIMWNLNDCVENAATQLIATLFSVPQISMLLHQLPDQHRKMLAFYLEFWNQNQEVLLDGELYAENPEANYSVVSAVKNRHQVSVVYVERPVKVKDVIDFVSIVNGTAEDILNIRFAEGLGEKSYVIYNCMGEPVEQGSVDCYGLKEFHVPAAGMIEIK